MVNIQDTDHPLTNWAGNVRFVASRLHRPGSLPELQDVVANSRRLRVLGTGHSFNTIADSTADLVSVADLPTRIEVDEGRRTVIVSAGTRFGDIAQAIDAQGWALHNLGSLPHISVAGAAATGTHGSGRTNGNLATAVNRLEFVTAAGESAHLDRGDPGFDGAVVALGTLGVVTALGLDIEPSYVIEQRVYEPLPLETLRANLLEVLGAAYSVSVFLTWQPPVRAQVWTRHRPDRGAWGYPRDFLGAPQADGARHPVPGMDPLSCTVQQGVPGPWHERLACFRLGFIPSAGDELQTEYLLPIEHANQALDALTELADRVAPVLWICELRTIAADELWLSEAYRQDSIALHFTWRMDPAAVVPVVGALEERLVPLGARPHWGKVFTITPSQIAAAYPRLPDARALFTSYDPDGKLRNEFVERYLFSS